MNATIAELRQLVSQNQDLRILFTFFTEWTKDNLISVDKMITATKHKVDRAAIVLACKTLDRLGLANFIAGRRESPSRVQFYVTPASIGKVALGYSDQLTEVAGQNSTGEVSAQTTGRPRSYNTSSSHDAPRFEVQHGHFGTMFILPANATRRDALALAKHIRQMQFSSVA